MNNSILISKVIYKILSDDNETKEAVKNRIYPLIAESDANFPFITFTRDNITSNYSKDGIYQDSVTFSVMVVAAKYLSSLDIANRIRHILEKRKIESKDLTLYDVKLIGISESFTEDSYTQELRFECTVE